METLKTTRDGERKTGLQGVRPPKPLPDRLPPAHPPPPSMLSGAQDQGAMNEDNALGAQAATYRGFVSGTFHLCLLLLEKPWGVPDPGTEGRGCMSKVNQLCLPRAPHCCSSSLKTGKGGQSSVWQARDAQWRCFMISLTLSSQWKLRWAVLPPLHLADHGPHSTAVPPAHRLSMSAGTNMPFRALVLNIYVQPPEKCLMTQGLTKSNRSKFIEAHLIQG